MNVSIGTCASANHELDQACASGAAVSACADDASLSDLTEPTIYIIDDDAGVRDSLALLLGLHNLRVLVFASAEDFLLACDSPRRGCILVDIRMPGMGGLELQRQLAIRAIGLPVVVMTGHGSVAASRVAFKAGAVDFLSKPISEVELIEAISNALALCQGEGCEMPAIRDAQASLNRLTTREKAVLDLLVEGFSIREAATKLAISHRTVEVYKARMMEKLRARNLSDIARIALLAKRNR